MSSGLGIDYAADHAELEVDRGLSVKFRGQTLSALVSIPENSREFEDDTTGFYQAAVLRITVRDAVVPNIGFSPIKEGELFTYDGDNYRARMVTHDSDSAITLIECESEAQ